MMDEFKIKAIAPNCDMDKPEKGTYDDMWTNTPKKFGRKAARRSLRRNTNQYYDEVAWNWDCSIEWDDHGNCDMICNELEEYGDWGDWDTETVKYQNMMEWTNDAIRY
jgi:hypothetical protein